MSLPSYRPHPSLLFLAVSLALASTAAAAPQATTLDAVQVTAAADASAQAREALKRNPALPTAHLLLAQVENARGRRKSAVRHILKAQEIAPAHTAVVEAAARYLGGCETEEPASDLTRS